MHSQQVGLQVWEHSDSLGGLEADKDICAALGEHGTCRSLAEPQEAEHAAALLCHSDRFRAHHGNIVRDRGRRDQL